MRIKKVTMHGFKSFVDRTEFALPEGTSAIIGPNGCGKSNIVDAIRWVIGEHNPRHLRGRLMEDLIFNGSDARGPLGMAEVSIVLSNTGAVLPAQYAGFSEIEVIRRLYRSGESEYFINKVDARLKDIVELFTDTGVGTRAYSIIEQGQVGWLVNAKPEERRTLFEEAAGINKYKGKKDAALRRLEASRENLTRVNDIIGEVKRQLNSLARLAKKAERYKVLKDELKAIELRLSSTEYRNGLALTNETNAALDALKCEEAVLLSDMASIEALAQERRLEAATKEEAYKGIREDVLLVEGEIHKDERASELIRLRKEELGRDEARLVMEMDELSRTMAALSDEAGRMLSSLEGMISGMAEKTGHIETREKEWARLCAAARDKEAGLRAAQKDLLDSHARAAGLRHSMEAALKEEDGLRIREARTRCEKEEAEKSLHALDCQMGGLNDQLSLSQARLADSRGRLSSGRERLARVEADRGAREEALNAVKERLSLAQSRLSALVEMDKNLEGLNEGVRSIMNLKDQGRVIGLVADVIETTPGYEKAVEAVLGERLHYVMVESQAQGEEAIEYLKSHSAGRTSFVPVRDVRLYPKDGLGENAGHGDSAELMGEVRVRQGYEAIVEYLLSDTLVVPDLASAKRLWEQNGQLKTFVTMDGEIIDQHGIMTGGSANGHDRGILQKRREMADLRGAVSSLEGERTGIEEEMGRLADEYAGMKAELDAIDESIRSSELENVNQSAELKSRSAEHKRLLDQMEGLSSGLVEIGKALAGLSLRKAGLANEMGLVDEELRQKEQALAIFEDETRTLGQEKDAVASLIADERVLLASLKERHESIKAQVADKERLCLEAQRKREARAAEVEGKGKEAEDCSRRLEGLKQRLDGLLVRRDALKKDELRAEESWKETVAEGTRLEARLKEKQSEMNLLGHRRSELALKLKETELSLSLLRERMMERYGVAIDAVDVACDEAVDASSMEARAAGLRESMASLGEVSLSALTEYGELEERHRFLLAQQADLNASVESLHGAITRINRTIRERFKTTFDEINEKFKETFPRLFSNGRAELRLMDEENILETGIEIVAQPAGKRLQSITLLSGGEKALTATALIFAIFLIKPSPFCLLDEVDAPLDDANIERFNSFVKEMSEKSQFVLITHNKRTMELADRLFGITMEEPGVSKVVAIEL